MRRPRRNHTAAFEVMVSLAALKGEKTLAELAEKFDVHANQMSHQHLVPLPVTVSTPRSVT